MAVTMRLYTITDWLGLILVFICLLFGMIDLFSFILIVLPLYLRTVNDFIYSVSLFAYTEAAEMNRIVYWAVFLLLILAGICGNGGIPAAVDQRNIVIQV